MNSSKCWLDESGGRRIWRACVRCESHGWVDEEISFDEAKTAFKACQIARERHYDCDGVVKQRQEELEREFALQQINTAGEQLSKYEARLSQAQAALAKLKSEKNASKAALELAEKIVTARRRDVEHASKRLDDTIEANAAALPLE